ncbi:2-hydroxyacylsphingosine 1-beta-galactosyltransferase-like [Paramuricea clavata]|uniref:UDP-glucuronosyltransferase n=1 Tax=Paramuricea clavata TaxID=317549 RepID=A0A6S7I892_PARCT|nr:2-hydroxyacylsphingosine 1-beta-galactosyltransferase-like [Paramuricea clavata]
MPYYSHLSGPANVGKFLQSQGHDVRIAIPPQMKEKMERHGVQLLLYNGLGEFPEDRYLQDLILKLYFEHTPSQLSRLYYKKDNLVVVTVRNTATKIIKDTILRKNIEKFKPDLIILDSNPLTIMLTLIPYKLDIPFVMMGSLGSPQCKRTPVLPTVFPMKFLPFTDQMTFQQRLLNTFVELLSYRRNPFINSSLIEEYVPEKPHISLIDLQAKAQLWITRQHSVLDYNHPTMPNEKTVAHLQNLTSKALPPDLQSFMENADNGVVIVSFGSVLNLPSQVKEKLLSAFQQTKYKFIMRTADIQHNNRSDKFMFRKWLPQYDLLRHHKTKLFISHCGSNGLQEALFAGVPILGFPIIGDQPNNAGKIIRKVYGLKLDLKSFSVQELVSAINEVTTNPKYKANVEKASAILKSERVPPIEEAAFWINHVLKFGGAHLRSYAQDIPLWKYLGLDIIAFCLLIWHVFVFLIIITLKYCLSRCCMSKQKLKDE